MLYIKVIGHNPMANMNNILVGNYPCIIPSDGVTTTFISCVTTDPGSQYDLKNQVITIMANDQTATAPTKFSYLGSSTPILQEIYPVAGYALENINFYGLPRITDLGNGRNFGSVGNLMIGNDLCSRFDIFQAPLGDTSTWASINCIQSSTQEAGYYRVS